MENQISVSGKLKNVREYKNNRGTLMVAQLTQRDEHDRLLDSIHSIRTRHPPRI